MANNKTVSKDFFATATRMTLTDLKKFLVNVVLPTDPRKLAPIVVWSAPGEAKSALVESVFNDTERGLKSVILSQIGPLDANGLAHIVKDTVGNKESEVTDFTPTLTFGRGRHHLFLDELNNAAPGTLAAVQNLLSSKKIGGDDFNDIHIIAACNPPSTNSLANDLNYPTVSRCINIVLDYTLDDFISYALSTGSIHPAIVAFHRKTNGTFLRANWSFSNSNMSVPEPGPNEPFPCPRSWSLASNVIQALTGAKTNAHVNYSLLKPLVEGSVGIAAANEFATTYAYMEKLPDIEKIFSGELDGSKKKLTNEVAVQFITMTALINYCIGEINRISSESIKCDTRSKESAAYKILAGLHRSVVYMGEATTAELASMTLQSICGVLRSSSDRISAEWMTKLLQGVDAKNGLTREAIIKYAVNSGTTDLNIQNSIG